jgi:hypothetical protein
MTKSQTPATEVGDAVFAAVASAIMKCPLQIVVGSEDEVKQAWWRMEMEREELKRK